MGRKSILNSYKMFDNVDISTNQTSNFTSVKNLDKAVIHIVWSGTSPVGTVTVQTRNADTESWKDVDMGGTISVSGNSGSHQLMFNEMPGIDLQLTYTASSGTGNLTASITAKVLGA